MKKKQGKNDKVKVEGKTRGNWLVYYVEVEVDWDKAAELYFDGKYDECLELIADEAGLVALPRMYVSKRWCQNLEEYYGPDKNILVFPDKASVNNPARFGHAVGHWVGWKVISSEQFADEFATLFRSAVERVRRRKKPK